MPIKAVFFDMGETLTYQDPSTPQILGDFLAAHGIRRLDAELRRAYLAAMTFFSRWALKLDVAERTPERREEMVGEFYRVMLRNLDLGDRLTLLPALRGAVLARRSDVYANTLFPDVLPTLEALRGRGLRLGIISNWDQTLTDLVHGVGLTRFMDAVVGSDSVGIEKPNAGIFHYAVGRLGIAPHEACHVGDIYYMDVLGARGAGLKAVLLDRHRLQIGVDCPRAEQLTKLITLLNEVGH